MRPSSMLGRSFIEVSFIEVNHFLDGMRVFYLFIIFFVFPTPHVLFFSLMEEALTWRVGLSWAFP